MLARFKPSFTIPSAGLLVLLLGGLALPVQAAVEVDNLSASGFDHLAATHGSSGSGHSLRNTDFTVDDLQKMENLQKRNADELENLKKIINDQARVIEELKRNSGSGSNSSSNSSDLSGLKRSVIDQDRVIEKLTSQVDDLKRSSGSSSSSSSSELSGLKRDVSDQQRDLDSLKRNVDDLSRKVK
ncbi:hypothetical protein [Pseudomonas sp. MWU12-2345]|uniref:hypothetical protein n=1 Tax=Pseudomonas sp. MWU12-2345 TaxID=2928689 RepID=UPI0020108185|nr:hypothetical protein [Pseudomonas sp. MWU12-2345]